MSTSSRVRFPRGLSIALFSSVGLGFTCFFPYQLYKVAIRKPLPTTTEINAVNASLGDTWKKSEHGKDFDSQTEWEEYWSFSGIAKRRQQLVSQATGQVLESAVGTGRNAGMYDSKKVTGFTLVDQSQAMLDVCREKWVKYRTHGEKATPVRFLIGDLGKDQIDQALRAVDVTVTNPRDGESGKFDTVVQTMGLCSTPDPVKLLNNLGQVVKQEGRVLLLEHGRSHYDWLNQYLEHTALDHAKEHGCWWNRDIGAIIDDSDLQVEEIKRYNFGTLWWIILKPKERPKAPVAVPSELPAATSKWWKIW